MKDDHPKGSKDVRSTGKPRSDIDAELQSLLRFAMWASAGAAVWFLNPEFGVTAFVAALFIGMRQ